MPIKGYKLLKSLQNQGVSMSQGEHLQLMAFVSFAVSSQL